MPQRHLKNRLQLHRLTLAVGSALALLAPAYAQVFDANSAAVRQAYVGAATQEKKDAALAGLRLIFSQAQQSGADVSIPSRYLLLSGSVNDAFKLKQLSDPSLRSNLEIQAASDTDLGLPGAAVFLDNTTLRTLASFNTARNFTIGTSGATIDTNGFNFGISGILTANGTLTKDGLGTLILTGNNVWNMAPQVVKGVLEGNTSSLQTAITNNATVRFNQTADGIYAGVMTTTNTASTTAGNLEKTGAAKLTLTSAQGYTGTTTISGGTLVLQGAASLENTSAINVGAGTTLDISGSQVATHNAGLLSGSGNIALGSNWLIADSNNSATFSGSISGAGGLNKAGNGTLTLTGVNTYTGGTVVYAGKLALEGNGRLNSSGGLFVANGATYDISSADGGRKVGGLYGFGAVTLGANNLTVDGEIRSDSLIPTFKGTISGSGGLTKTGIGSQALLGTNTYTGVTTIDQGDLHAYAQAVSDRIVNNATLTLVENRGSPGNPVLSAYSGTISGTGKLVKTGEDFIWLRGRNTYTGGTEIKEGMLIGNTDSLQGNINVSKGASLAFYQIDNDTYAGVVSGSGSLAHLGPGVLTLTGTNTHTGGTAFSGTLRVDRDANLGSANGAVVMAGGTLQLGADMSTARTIALAPAGGTFDTNGHQLTVTGNVSGDGSLTKAGAGTLALNGVNLFTGPTTITAGRLEFNGSSRSNITVAAGGELGGMGNINGNVVNHGVWARGNSIGNIEVFGTVGFEPGSTFAVKTNAAGESDRLWLQPVLGLLMIGAPPPPPQNVVINGGTVDVRAESGNYNRRTRYNIINAFGGVTGQFNGVTSNLAFLTPSLAYDPNNVYLTLTRNDLSYTAVAQNPNQFAIAQGLNRMANGATGDMATVTNALDGLSAQQARAAFDSIGAAGRTLMPVSLNVNQRSINQNLVARLGMADGGNTLAPATGIANRGVQLAFDESTRHDAAPVYAQLGLPFGTSGTGFRASNADTHNGLWLRGYGGSGRLDGDANAPGAKYRYGGTLLGYDHKFGNATAGVFAAYAEPRYNQDAGASAAKTKTWQVGAYGRYVSGAWHIDGVASYARSDTDTSRLVSVGGLNRLASGSFNGNALSAHVETGYTLKAGSFEVQPLAALSWVRQHQDAYAETGAGALNLLLPDQSQESLRSSLGARTLHPFHAGGMQWVFETRAAWSHEFKTARSVNARLAGDPAAGVFTVSGPNVPRDSAVLGMGIAAQASKNLRLYADVNTELNGASRAYAVSAGLRYQW